MSDGSGDRPSSTVVRFLSKQLRLLKNIAYAANAGASLDLSVSRILPMLQDLDNVEGIGLYVIDEATQNLILRAHSGLPQWFASLVEVIEPMSPERELVSRQEPQFDAAEGFPNPIRSRLAQAGIAALGVLPIEHGGKAVGVLNVASTSSRSFAVSTVAILESITPILGAMIARSLQNQKFAQSEQTLQSIIASLQDLGFVISSENARILYATPSAQRALGYTLEELCKLTVSDLHPSEVGDDVQRTLDAMAKSGLEYCRLPVMTKAGRRIAAESRVFHGQWQGESVLFGLVRTASGGSVAGSVREPPDDSLFKRLLDNIPEGVYVRSVDGRIVYANAALSRIHGMPASELVGRHANDLLVTEDVEGLRMDGVFTSLANGIPVTTSARCRRPNGVLRHLEITAIPCQPCAQTQEVLGFVRDVTDREEALLSTVKSLTDIIHEARTPLSVIKGYTDLLGGSDRLAMTDAERSGALAMVSGNISRLTTILEDALEAERLASVPDRSQMIAVDLGALVEEVADEYRSLAEQRGIRYELSICADAYVYGDRSLLARLIGNVLSNAIKYSADGAVHVTVETKMHRVQVLIRDDGIGIAREEIERVFQRFYRSSDPDVRRQEGSGLGLHIARNIAHAHRGTIEIRSEQGHGTAVAIDLPAASIQHVSAGHAVDSQTD